MEVSLEEAIFIHFKVPVPYYSLYSPSPNISRPRFDDHCAFCRAWPCHLEFCRPVSPSTSALPAMLLTSILTVRVTSSSYPSLWDKSLLRLLFQRMRRDECGQCTPNLFLTAIFFLSPCPTPILDCSPQVDRVHGLVSLLVAAFARYDRDVY